MKSSKRTIENRTILITGASSGFGKAAAALLAKNGYRVFGTSRQGDKHDASEYEMLSLDVRSDESVRFLSVVTSRSPLLRYRIGTEAVWLPRVKAMMPQKAFEIGVRKTFQLDA